MKHFTFSKEITLGDLATIVVLVVWLAKIDFRTNQNEESITKLASVQETQAESVDRLSKSQVMLSAVISERTGKPLPQ